MTPTDRSTGVTALSDTQLMARVQAGCTEAFGELYDRYCDRASRVALSVCWDAGRAEDAVQNAFLSIWTSRGNYLEQRGTVAAWVMTCVRRRAIDVARSSATDAPPLADPDSVEALSAEGGTVERVEARAHSQHLRSLLDSLPDAQREVVTLAFFGGLSHSEIATRLGLPAGTVKGRMRLGLQKLRGIIEAGVA